MAKIDDDAPLTLDDEQIVSRRQAIGLAALALGAAGTLAASPAHADDDSQESDTSSDTSADTAESDDSSEEQQEGDGDG